MSYFDIRVSAIFRGEILNFPHFDILEIKDLLKVKYRQMLKHPEIKVRPLYIEGHKGIGKSQIIRQAAEELSEELCEILKGEKVNCRTINLQFTERPDFMGAQYITDDKKAAFAYPSLLPESGYGIYFLDEANRVERDIRSGMLTLLEDREINGHKIGKFWLPVLAGNPNDDNYEVNEFDAALSDRIAKVILDGKIEHTLIYLNKKYPGHPLVEFLNHHQNFVSFSGSGISPRSFEYAITSTLIDPGEEMTEKLLSAELGYDAAATILAFLNDNRAPKYEDLIGAKAEEVVLWVEKNSHRNDAVAIINRALVADLRQRIEQKEVFNTYEKSAVQKYLQIIRDEHKHSLVVETNKAGITLDFITIFVQGTSMVDTFIKMYSNQKSRD